MKKRLIVNADDFGIHETVNKAVYRGFESGILTSTSIMAGGRAFDDAVAMAKTMGDIGIGIHLTLVGGLETVLSVTHIDGHQHMHMWNNFFPIALSLAKKYKIHCMRVPDESLTFGLSFRPKSLFRFSAKNALSLMARNHRDSLKKAGIKSNDHFFGMLYGGHFHEQRMYDAAGKLEAGVTEFMCHPAANSQLMESTFHWGYHGEDELKALLSLRLKNELKEKDVELISYRDL